MYLCTRKKHRKKIYEDMLSVLVVVGLTLLMIKNFQKGVLLIFILSPFLSLCADIGKLPVLSGLNIIMFGLYILIYQSRIKEIRIYPLFTGSVLIVISLFLCNAFGDEVHTPNAIMNAVNVLVLFVLYDVARRMTMGRARWALNAIIIFAIVVIVNGLVETFAGTNILLDTFMNIGLYEEDTKTIMGERFGLKRAQSIFGMHTSLAGYAVPPLAFLLYLRQKTSMKLSAISVAVIIGLGAMVLFTGARSGIIGMAISLLCVVDKKLIKGQYIIIAVLIAIFILPFVSEYFETIIASIQDTEKVGGSNTSMREEQLNISLYYMSKHPWFGNGIAYTWRISTQFSEELFGAESMWFPVMIDRGLFGVFALAYLCVSLTLYVYRSRIKKFTFLVLGFFVFNTMSSIPDVPWMYMATYVFLMERYFALYGVEQKRVVSNVAPQNGNMTINTITAKKS